LGKKKRASEQLFFSYKLNYTCTLGIFLKVNLMNNMKQRVSEFYNKIQFPGHYTQKNVMEKYDDFYLEKYLAISYLKSRPKILDAGCGTGFTTHVISSLRTDAEILGIDFSKGSIEFAKNFSKNHNYPKVRFELMDLKNLQLNSKFDLIHCSGVLHHIENPRPIFTNLCKLLEPEGLFILGLYHNFGRFSTHVRQKIFKLTRGRFKSIDPRLRKENWSNERKQIWFNDQYQHPHEDSYSHRTVLKWFKEENLEFIGSIPKFDNSFDFDFKMLTTTGSQGGLFIFIGKKSTTKGK